ncbi:MAG: ligase, partial [Cyanobacteriota bacterium]
GGGIYAWQTRRYFTQAMAELPTHQEAFGQSPVPSTPPTAIAGPTSEAILHIQGKLRHLEQDLQKSQTALQATLADRDELSHNYQSQEKVLATLRHQLTQQQAEEGDRLSALKRQNQELLQENSNLSDRLRQSVNSLAEARPKLLQLETLEAKNQQLTEQLRQVTQDRPTVMTPQWAEREKTWQQQNQTLIDQVGQLERQVEQLTTERDHAQRDLGTLNERAAVSQDQIKALEAALQKLTQAQQAWQGERDQLNAKLTNLDATQQSLALTNQALTVKLEATQAQGDRLKAEKKEQALALQGAQADLVKLQQQLVDLIEAQAQFPAQLDVPPTESKAGGIDPDATVTESQTLESPLELELEVVPESEPDVDTGANNAKPLIETEAEPGVDTHADIVVPVVETEAESESIVPQWDGMEHIPPTTTVPEPAMESTTEPEAMGAIESNAKPDPEPPVTTEVLQNHSFNDKKVVILGTLNAMNRETAKNRLQDLGAHYTSAPSSKTDYVVVGKAPGAKLKKAQKLGIPQLSEAQFLEMLGE